MSTSPFELFRRNLKPLMIALTVLAMLAFVVLPAVDSWVRQRGPGGGDGAVVASYRGGDFAYDRINRFTRNHYSTLQFLSELAKETVERGGTLNVPGFAYDEQRQQISQWGINNQPSAETSVSVQLYAQRAKELGFDLDHAAVRVWLSQFTDNQLSDDQINLILRRATDRQLGQHDMLEQLRMHLLANAVQQTSLAGLFASGRTTVPPAQQYALYLRLNQRAGAVAYPVLVDEYLDKTNPEPSEAEIQEVFEEGKDVYPDDTSDKPGFRRRPTATFEVVSGNFDAFIERMAAEVPEEELRAEYEKQVAAGGFVIPAEEADPPGETPQNEADPAEPAPAEDAPMQDAPAEAPATEEPASEEPASEEPMEEESPVGDEPVTEEPASEEPTGEEPMEDESPAGDEPVTEEPATEEPTGEEPMEEESPAGDEPVTEEPATEEPTGEEPMEEESPAGEEPVTEEPTTEEPTGEEPMEEESPAGEEPVTEEQPATEEPTGEESEDQAARSQPRAVQLVAMRAQDTPAEEPAAEEPAEETSAEEPAAEETPSEGEPEAADQPKVRPFEEVRDQVAQQMVTPEAFTQVRENLEKIKDVMQEYSVDYNVYQAELEDETAEGPPPEQPDIEALAEQLGLDYEKIGPHDIRSLQETAVGQSMSMTGQFQAGDSFPQLMFGGDEGLYSPVETTNFRSSQSFVSWKTEQTPDKVPMLVEVRDEVISAIRYREARELARQAAEALVAKANNSDKPLQELVPEDRQEFVYDDLGEFPWMLWLGPGRMPMVWNLEQLNRVGDAFMRQVFTQPIGHYGVAPNQPGTVFYVVKTTKRTPSQEELRKQFLQATERETVQGMMTQDTIELSQAYQQEYRDSLDLQWNNQE